MTPLEKTLKRALRIDGRDYVVTLTPEADLISGDSALAIALQASVGRLQSGSRPPATSNPGSRAKAATTPRAAPGRRPAPKHQRRPSRRSRPRNGGD